MEEDIRKVMALRDGENCTVFWSEEGGGIVYRCNGMFLLFSVPKYGGREVYEKTYSKHQIVVMVSEAYSWT